MPTSMVDEAGNVWEVDDAGNPVRLVAAAAKGRVFSLPPNPKDVQQQRHQESIDARGERAQDRADTTAEVANRLKEQEIRLASQKEQREGNTAKDIAGWRANLNNIGLLEGRVKKLRELYARDFAGKGLQSVGESYAPAAVAPQYGVFDDVGGQMLADMAKAKGLTSQQFNTPVEQRMFFEPLIPKRGDTDEQIVNKLDYLDQMIATGRRTTEENLGLNHQKADNEVPDPDTGADLKPPPADNSPDDRPPENDANTGAASGKSRITYDPRMSSQIDAMINAGASKGMIDAVLKRQDFPVVTPGEWSAIQGWRQKNPGKKYYGANISRDDDLSFRQRLSGSALGSGLAHAADAGTAGLVSLASGEEGRGALDAMSALHPEASTVGDVAGGVTGALGAEASIAARAPSALVKYAPRVADALYGGALGFNTAREGEGLKGAALGAGAGLVGGAIGERAMGGAGRIARGVRDANAGYLRGQGVPLTVGQLVANSGRLGATVKNVEDALTSVPGVSSIVNARRTEGLGAFNEAAMRQAGAPAGIPVTASGSQGMEQLRQGIGPAYDNALGGAQIDANDPAFLAGVADLVNASNAIPPVGGTREAAAAAIENRIGGATDDATGMMSGRGFQEAYRGLGRTARERAGGDYGHEVGQVMRQGQNVLADALDAQNPGALEAFRNANAVNRNANVIAQALDKAKNQGNELFTPAQINTADAMSTRRLEGPMASAAGDRPFFDLARAGQEVLPSRLPDSGTATRGLIGAGLLGGFGGAGVGSAFGDPSTGAQTGLGLTLLLAAGGSKPAQKAMTKILADRPDLAIRIGNQLVDYAGVGGWTGSGTLAPLLIEP